MSYILDALRKSAEDRRKLQEQKPASYGPLATAQGSGGRRGKSRSGVVVTILLLLGTLSGFWLYYSQTKPDPVPDSSTQAHVAPEKDALAEQNDAKTTEATPQAADESPTVPAAQSPQLSPPIEELSQDPKSRPIPEKSVPPSSPDPVPLLQDLPFATQAAIPEMKFSGHVFSSDPALRMIMVNTAIVREGDMITSDIKLIEITEKGLVLGYRETPFRIELF
jgi:general secretion pathway protein B